MAQESVLVRQRQDSDMSQAAAGLVRVHALDGYPVEGVSQPEAWLTPPGMMNAWVAEKSGTVVGHVAVSRPEDEWAVTLWTEQSGERASSVAVLARLFVVPEARKMAAGESLMRAAVDYARGQGIRLVLDVLAKDRAAIRLYTRLGWKNIGSAAHAFGAGEEAEAFCFVSPATG